MAKARIKREKDVEAGTVTFTEIESGKTVTADVKELFPDYANMSDVQRQTILHAINAKVGDSAASPDTNAIDAMQSTWDQVKGGTWNARGTGEGSARVTVLAEAVAALRDMPVEEVVSRLADMSKEQKDNLAKHGQVEAKMKEIKAKRAAEAAKKAKASAKDEAPLDF